MVQQVLRPRKRRANPLSCVYDSYPKPPMAERVFETQPLELPLATR